VDVEGPVPAILDFIQQAVFVIVRQSAGMVEQLANVQDRGIIDAVMNVDAFETQIRQIFGHRMLQIDEPPIAELHDHRGGEHLGDAGNVEAAVRVRAAAGTGEIQLSRRRFSPRGSWMPYVPSSFPRR
jgi:hypothetical protein